MNTLSPRLEEGKFFLETVWYKVAISVVQEAIRFYELDEEQAAALKAVFLRPNNYPIELIR
jgi:hypothetical protein